MDFATFLSFFNKTDIPFTLLFVALFFYTIRSNSLREKNMTDITENKLAEMQDDMRVLMKIWQILLEKELKQQEASKDDNHNNNGKPV